MFTFQQFKVYQEHAAMKVGTDGVLLGAWTPVDHQPLRILDVGSGTGLVALMLAQRTEDAMIDAVEIDASACIDAQKNFEISRWNHRLNLYASSFQSFVEDAECKYDLIVSNPPFFSGSLKNSCQLRATARHNDALSQEDLIDGIIRLLSDEGIFALILPVPDYKDFRIIATRAGLFECRRLEVIPNPGKPIKRVISVWSKNPVSEFVAESVVVELSRHNYSPVFKRIVSGFFLAF